jgi:hypothetical protein
MRLLAACVVVFACHHSDPAPATLPSNQAPPAPAPMVAQPAASTGVAACDELLGRYERYFECDKFKQSGSAAVAATRDGVTAMKQGFAQLTDAPAAAKDAAREGCTQAIDALTRSARAMGCAL